MRSIISGRKHFYPKAAAASIHTFRPESRGNSEGNGTTNFVLGGVNKCVPHMTCARSASCNKRRVIAPFSLFYQRYWSISILFVKSHETTYLSWLAHNLAPHRQYNDDRPALVAVISAMCLTCHVQCNTAMLTDLLVLHSHQLRARRSRVCVWYVCMCHCQDAVTAATKIWHARNNALTKMREVGEAQAAVPYGQT